MVKVLIFWKSIFLRKRNSPLFGFLFLSKPVYKQRKLYFFLILCVCAETVTLPVKTTVSQFQAKKFHLYSVYHHFKAMGFAWPVTTAKNLSVTVGTASGFLTAFDRSKLSIFFTGMNFTFLIIEYEYGIFWPLYLFHLL